MRGSKAKKIRKAVYGDASHRTREYDGFHSRERIVYVYENGRRVLNPDGTLKQRRVVIPGTIQNQGLRRKYQLLKKISMQMA